MRRLRAEMVVRPLLLADSPGRVWWGRGVRVGQLGVAGHLLVRLRLQALVRFLVQSLLRLHAWCWGHGRADLVGRAVPPCLWCLRPARWCVL